MNNNNVNRDMENKDNWSSWSLYIIKTIESLQQRVNTLEEETITSNLEIQKELTKIHISAKITSIVAGLIASIIVSVVSGFFVYKITEDAKPEEPKILYENKR